MKEVTALITTLGNEGASPGAIAEELNRRGLRDRRNMPFTPFAVHGFMRVLGIGPTEVECIELQAPDGCTAGITDAPHRVSDDPLTRPEDDAYEAGEEPPAKYRGEYAHIGGAIYQGSYRPAVLREWPIHTDFRPDELKVRD